MDDNYFISNFGRDLMPPFEPLNDLLHWDAFHSDVVSLWHATFTI